MTPKKWRRGFPDGDPALVLPAGYYEEIYGRHLRNRSGLWGRWAKQSGKHIWYAALALAEPPLLDVGCGAGHLAQMCDDFGIRFAYAGGIDYSRSAIALAQHNAPWAHFGLGDASRHAELLRRGHFRTAVLLEVLEHIYEDLELLRKIPAGRGVVFSVPSFVTEGHCRWFANAGQVKKRYEPLVAIERVIVEEGISSDNRWFIVKGLRR